MQPMDCDEKINPTPSFSKSGSRLAVDPHHANEAQSGEKFPAGTAQRPLAQEGENMSILPQLGLDREMGVDSLQDVATQPRLVFVEKTKDDLRWALPHDRTCALYRAQELVECVLQSLVEMRMMLPQDDDKLAYLITWVTSTLEERKVLPMVAQDIANVFGALDFMWPHKEVWTYTCSAGDEWNAEVCHIYGFEMSPGSVGRGGLT